MSDVFQPTEFDHLNETTSLIVDGFINEQTKDIFQHIPDIINTVTLRFVDDHFMMNRGSYQWKISSAQQVQRILTAQPDSCLNSDVFEMSGLQWMIELYPNGRSATPMAAGNVGLFIKLLVLPKEWRYVLLQATVICHETNTIGHHIFKYDKGTMC